jgi:hypothetical protein
MNPMRFGNYVWPQNPETVTVARKKALGSYWIPGAGDVVQDLGCAGRTVSGSGCFTGPDCLAEYGRLAAVFAEEGPALLCLPGFRPFPAVFSSLSMKGEGGPDCLKYEFAFSEDGSQQAEESEVAILRKIICSGGETLWEIAASIGSDVDSLLTANPGIEWPNNLPAGTEVAIP